MKSLSEWINLVDMVLDSKQPHELDLSYQISTVKCPFRWTIIETWLSHDHLKPPSSLGSVFYDEVIIYYFNTIIWRGLHTVYYRFCQSQWKANFPSLLLIIVCLFIIYLSFGLSKSSSANLCSLIISLFCVYPSAGSFSIHWTLWNKHFR